MPLINWEKSFEIGIEELDDHHKQLVELLNKTYDDIITGADHETLEKILNALIDYATYHFTAEEYWMKLHGYPGLTQQCQDHNMFIERIIQIRKDFREGKYNLTIEVLYFIKNWLQEHILEKDAAYGRFAAGLPHDSY